MNTLFQSSLGRLRIIGYLEGISLIVLVFVAVPIKYFQHDPAMVKTLGPIHGILFLLFVFNTISVGVERRWRFNTTTWKVLVACLIPFGTFYVDRKILAKEAAGVRISR